MWESPVESGSRSLDAAITCGSMSDDLCEAHDYTCWHRHAWTLLLGETGSETLKASDLKSWMRLWGRLGAELYRCFRDGDQHVRNDMIRLARQ